MSDFDLLAEYTKDLVRKHAEEQGIDPDYATRIVDRESVHFKPEVLLGKQKSPKGAIGAGQLMPGTAQEVGVDPFNLEDNVKGSMAYLGKQLKQFGGDQKLGAAAYNSGPGNAKSGNWKKIKETRDYVAAVAPDDDLLSQFLKAQKEEKNTPAQTAAQKKLAPTKETQPSPFDFKNQPVVPDYSDTRKVLERGHRLGKPETPNQTITNIATGAGQGVSGLAKTLSVLQMGNPANVANAVEQYRGAEAEEKKMQAVADEDPSLKGKIVRGVTSGAMQLPLYAATSGAGTVGQMGLMGGIAASQADWSDPATAATETALASAVPVVGGAVGKTLTKIGKPVLGALAEKFAPPVAMGGTNIAQGYVASKVAGTPYTAENAIEQGITGAALSLDSVFQSGHGTPGDTGNADSSKTRIADPKIQAAIEARKLALEREQVRLQTIRDKSVTNLKQAKNDPTLWERRQNAANLAAIPENPTLEPAGKTEPFRGRVTKVGVVNPEAAEAPPLGNVTKAEVVNPRGQVEEPVEPESPPIGDLRQTRAALNRQLMEAAAGRMPEKGMALARKVEALQNQVRDLDKQIATSNVVETPRINPVTEPGSIAYEMANKEPAPQVETQPEAPITQESVSQETPIGQMPVTPARPGEGEGAEIVPLKVQESPVLSTEQPVNPVSQNGNIPVQENVQETPAKPEQAPEQTVSPEPPVSAAVETAPTTEEPVKAEKGPHGYLYSMLHKGASKGGADSFLKDADVQTALGLENASSKDAQKALRDALGVPSLTTVPPERLMAWARNQGLDKTPAWDKLTWAYKEHVRKNQPTVPPESAYYANKANGATQNGNVTEGGNAVSVRPETPTGAPSLEETLKASINKENGRSKDGLQVISDTDLSDLAASYSDRNKTVPPDVQAEIQRRKDLEPKGSVVGFQDGEYVYEHPGDTIPPDVPRDESKIPPPINISPAGVELGRNEPTEEVQASPRKKTPKVSTDDESPNAMVNRILDEGREMTPEEKKIYQEKVNRNFPRPNALGKQFGGKTEAEILADPNVSLRHGGVGVTKESIQSVGKALGKNDLIGWGLKASNAMRGAKLLGHFTALGKNNWLNTLTHPVETAEAAKNMLKAYNSESYNKSVDEFSNSHEAAVGRLAGLNNREETHLRMKVDGLTKDLKAAGVKTRDIRAITQGAETAADYRDVIKNLEDWKKDIKAPTVGFSAEETVDANRAQDEALPVAIRGKAGKAYEAVNRPFMAALDTASQLRWRSEVQRLESKGKTFESHPELYKQLAKEINMSVGRGTFGETGEKLAPFLSHFFISPRFWKAQWDIVNPAFFMERGGPNGFRLKDPEVIRYQVRHRMQAMGTVLAMVGAAKGVASQFKTKADLDTDPDSPEFLNLKIGNKVMDIGGAATPMARYMVRMGKVMKDYGKGDLDKDEAYGKAMSLTGNLIKSKLNPAPGEMVKVGMLHQKADLKQTLINTVVPIFIQDAFQELHDNGGLHDVHWEDMIPSGLGIRTYTSKKSARLPGETDASYQRRLHP